MTTNPLFETLIAKNKILVDLIEYQSQAVVSKTLISQNNATITLFAFDKGQALSEHSAPFEAIVQIIQGTAEINIAKETKIVSSGEIIILPADTPHSLKAAERFKMMLIMIKNTL
ncbi:MAG: cupin domain-containing protein [Candidatus Omnitrophica bacterium]|nr:cupin domain-containing protein [Candidatus Omnitrophota bacterium]